jgi:hypothetical protein
MGRLVKASIVVVVVLMSIAGSAFLSSQSTAAAHAGGAPTLTQPAGNDFGLHPHADVGFCLEDIPSAVNHSPASVQQCAARPSQDWMFARTTSGASGLIDGSGRCLQFGGTKVQAIEITACTLVGIQQFLYSATGQITTTDGKFCLQDAQAASAAAVTMPHCVPGLDTQVWILSH